MSRGAPAARAPVVSGQEGSEEPDCLTPSNETAEYDGHDGWRFRPRLPISEKPSVSAAEWTIKENRLTACLPW